MSKISIICIALALLAGCDPCRTVAEKICECRESEAERMQCKEDLNLPKSQKFFDTALEPTMCEEARQNCSCKKLLNGQDEKCGFFRQLLK